MRIVALGDVHSDNENIMQFLDKVSMLKPDAVVFTGDFIDVGIDFKGFTYDDIVKIILEELKALAAPIIVVPGNQDREILGALEKHGVSLHGSGIMLGGVGFYGFGGARTPFGTPLEPSEDEIETGLRNGYEKVRNAKVKVQVTHMPPYNTKLDIISTGAHVGSLVVRKVIEEFKPVAAICGHIHEARGVDFISDTKIINVGRLPEGYCGAIDIDVANASASAKVVNLI